MLLFFVGLVNAELSMLRVATRVEQGGHSIAEPTLRKRFPKTQRAISEAVTIADASILVDNSRSEAEALTVCRIQIETHKIYDIRDQPPAPPIAIAANRHHRMDGQGKPESDLISGC